MKNIKIPSSFVLNGQKITVTQRDDLLKDADCFGRWWMTRNSIEVQKPTDEISDVFLQQVFCHEVVHALLDAAGYPKLSAKEQLVDRIGHRLFEFLTTQK